MVGVNGANVSATVEPGEAETTYFVEYGLTTAYGQQTAVSGPLPADNGEHPIVVSIQGLQPGTTYRWRLVATNSQSPAGGTLGVDHIFTTYTYTQGQSASGPTGLPDGRTYEEVSPAYKSGNFYNIPNRLTFGLASAGGDAVLYPMSGAVGAAYAGTLGNYVSKRTSQSGWQTSAASPRPLSNDIGISTYPLAFTPSADFSRFVYTSPLADVAAEPKNEAGFNATSSVNIFLSEDPAVEPLWLGKPIISEPFPAEGEAEDKSYVLAGASPTLNTVYFTYEGTLVPEDAPRAPLVKSVVTAGHGPDPWGFYEWADGRLVSAGVLPNGTVSPFGAVPAGVVANAPLKGIEWWEPQARDLHNEVSEDGSRAFFVSPDPYAEAPEASELYVRVPSPAGGKTSLLVSGSTLPGHEGEPAPHGATFSFASPDGTHVFFSSVNQLTAASPENSEPKEYDYDVDTGALMYLPGVSRTIAVVSHDASELLFEAGNRVELWRRGSGGGSVTPVMQGNGGFAISVPSPNPHVSADGNVFVFRSSASIPGLNDAGGEQVYRYDVPRQEVDCLSCAPAGTPSGETRMSYNNNEDDPEVLVKDNGYAGDPTSTVETRGMSADGSRVFFDTTAALVPQDTNGVRDVYEWDNGVTFLISSGADPKESQILDSSESGGDVFFATQQGLVPGDSDEAYDVYDARIPRPGDNPAPAQVPCQGSVCQGPPSVPDLLAAPASVTFSGTGNLVPKVQAKVKSAIKPKRKHRKRKHRRKARKVTGRKGKKATINGKAPRNGRGKR